MNIEEEYNIAARYRNVRKHLDSLGYKQALSLDALPLIEKLLADLIQTTESLKYFKSIAQENIEACSQLQSTVDPYKCDNARLVRECNQLHLNLIEAKENHQKQVKDLKKEIHKLECECNDLQLASSRNLQRIKELEIESSRKSKKILELQGKCLKPTISNVGLATRKRSCYPLRRPVLESEPLPKTGDSAKSLPSLCSVEPKIIDLLSMADHKMSCLNHEVTKLKGELSLQTDNVHSLESQIMSKEKEIMRLKKMLEGGRPYSAVVKDCVCKKTEKNMVLNDSIDTDELRVLQQAKLELEQQLKEALNKQHDAMSQALKLAERNEELEKELRDIDHIALAVEADCNSAVKENNRRVCKLQEKLEDVMTQVHVLEGELTVERREVQELRADLEACRLEKRNIQRTLDSTLDEKKQMTDRINELTIIEQSLNDEIERLAKENESQKQDIIQLQYTNKMLKEQMHMKDITQSSDGDDLNRVKEKGLKNDHNKASKNHRDVFSFSMPEKNDTEDKRTAKVDEITNNIAYNDLRMQLDEKQEQINSLQHTIGQLSKERDYYRDEYKNMRDQRNKATDNENADSWTRIRELKRELSEKENALDELQREKKELYREKANLETRLQICRNEHRKSYQPCSVCKHADPCICPLSPPTSSRDVSITKTMLERLEHERDIARADVQRLIEERDALRERLKMATEAHTSEQRRLRESLTDVETRLKHIEKERRELLLTQGSRRATINGLEDQLDDMREELRRTKQDLATQRTQYFQLRALQDQTDQALGDVQNQLSQSETELNKSMDRNRAMERQQIQLENQVKDLKQEINTLRTSMTHIDHEKDQLLMVLDEKTERIAALEREIMSKEQQAIGTEQQIRELQHRNEICIDKSAEQEQQLRVKQLEMENLRRQLDTAAADRENAILENRGLQDDLAAVTCEVRNLQRELEASRAESYDLKRQLQTYVSEVRRAEELLNRKENERTEMLNHFRSLSLEATVLENNNHSLESEAAEARGALQSARDRLLDLERQLTDKDCLIRGYETQISELTQNVASMETQLRQQGEQRHRAEADLTAVRDLCVKLDQQKDALMQQLGDKDALKAQYDTQIARLKAEQSVIQDQMNRDRATVERLETLLDQARQETMNSQTANQELQNEMSRLKQEISELQSKLSAESAELRQYQNQAAEYNKQISELRRQMTNERFDRARKDEESRRNSEISSSTYFHQESSRDPMQVPSRSIARTSNEWNGTVTQRSLNSTPDSFNNERKADHRVENGKNEAKTLEEINHSRTYRLNETNECRCLERNRTFNSKDVNENNTINCISITLRRGCTAKTRGCDYWKNNFTENHAATISRNKEDFVEAKTQTVAESFDKKYEFDDLKDGKPKDPRTTTDQQKDDEGKYVLDNKQVCNLASCSTVLRDPTSSTRQPFTSIDPSYERRSANTSDRVLTRNSEYTKDNETKLSTSRSKDLVESGFIETKTQAIHETFDKKYEFDSLNIGKMKNLHAPLTFAKQDDESKYDFGNEQFCDLKSCSSIRQSLPSSIRQQPFTSVGQSYDRKKPTNITDRVVVQNSEYTKYNKDQVKGDFIKTKAQATHDTFDTKFDSFNFANEKNPLAASTFVKEENRKYDLGDKQFCDEKSCSNVMQNRVFNVRQPFTFLGPSYDIEEPTNVSNRIVTRNSEYSKDNKFSSTKSIPSNVVTLNAEEREFKHSTPLRSTDLQRDMSNKINDSQNLNEITPYVNETRSKNRNEKSTKSYAYSNKKDITTLNVGSPVKEASERQNTSVHFNKSSLKSNVDTSRNIAFNDTLNSTEYKIVVSDHCLCRSSQTVSTKQGDLTTLKIGSPVKEASERQNTSVHFNESSLKSNLDTSRNIAFNDTLNSMEYKIVVSDHCLCRSSQTVSTRRGDLTTLKIGSPVKEASERQNTSVHLNESSLKSNLDTSRNIAFNDTLNSMEYKIVVSDHCLCRSSHTVSTRRGDLTTLKIGSPVKEASERQNTSVHLNESSLKSNLNTSRNISHGNTLNLTSYRSILSDHCLCRSSYVTPYNMTSLATKELEDNSRDKPVGDKRIYKSSPETCDAKFDITKHVKTDVTSKKVKHSSKEDDVICCSNTPYDATNYSMMKVKKCPKIFNNETMQFKSGNYVKSHDESVLTKNRNVQENKSTDGTLRILRRVLERAEKLREKRESEGYNVFADEQKERTKHKREKPKYVQKQNETDSTEFSTNPSNLCDLTKPELLKLLAETREHTRILEEQLAYVCKTMKNKRRITEKFASNSSRDTTLFPLCDKNGKSSVLQRNANTQMPDKKNASIQQSNPQHSNSTKLAAENTNIVRSKEITNTNIGKINERDKVGLERSKKEIYKYDYNRETVTEPVQIEKYTGHNKEDSNLPVKHSKALKSTESYNKKNIDNLITKNAIRRNDTTKSIINRTNLNVTKSPKNFDALRTFGCSEKCGFEQSNQNDENVSSSPELNMKQREMCFAILPESLMYSTEGQNKQENIVTNITTPGTSNLHEERTLYNNKRRPDCSCYNQANVLFNENLPGNRDTKIAEIKPMITQSNELSTNAINDINSRKAKKSSVKEKNGANVTLLLTKRLNNVCLKSKHRKPKFMRFKGKCIMCSPVVCEESVISKFPNDKRLKKAIRCNLEHCISFNNYLGNSSVSMRRSTDNSTVSDSFLTACTQSSNFYITAATSTSSITLQEPSETLNRTSEKENCTLS